MFCRRSVWRRQCPEHASVYDMAAYHLPSADDGHLENDRARNDQKLKSRFEHIFRKYEHDFTGVADEIDIHEGAIVVNNGHIEHMRSDVDPGRSASSRFLLETFQHNLENESEHASSGSDDDEHLEDSHESDGHITGGDGSGKAVNLRTHTLISNASQQDSLRALGSMKRPARLPRLAQLLVGDGTPDSPIAIGDDNAQAMLHESTHRSMSGAATPAAVLAEGLAQSAAAVHASDGRRAAIDPDTIQALGTSIADRLAQLMGSSKKASKAPKVQAQSSAANPLWNYPELPPAPKEKRKRSSSPALPTASSPPSAASGDKSLWSGEADPAAARKRRRRNLYAEVIEPPVRRFGANADAVEQKRCWNCSLTRSPNWIHGPHGQDLCASCGQYYQHHGRMKPFDSPTPPPPGTMESDMQVKEENEEPIMLVNQAMAVEEAQPGAERQDDERQLEPKLSSFGRRCSPPPSMLCSNSSVSYAANTSRPMIRARLPKQVRLRWTAEENARMIKLKEADDLSWEEISEHFPNRSAGSLQVHYSSHLKSQKSESRDLFDRHVATDEHITDGIAIEDSTVEGSVTEEASTEDAPESPQIAGWGEQHDALLLELIEDQGLGWHEVATLLPGGDVEAVKRRYEVITDDNYEQSTTNAVLDRAFSPPLEVPQSPSRWYAPEEDELISRLVDQGLTWYDMAKHFHGRAPGSLHKRYTTKLKASHTRTRRSLPTASLSGLQSSATPLLRRALRNNLRRQSDRLVQYQPDGESQGTQAAVAVDHEHVSGVLEPTPEPPPNQDQQRTPQLESLAPSQQLEEELLRSSIFSSDGQSAVAPPKIDDEPSHSPTPESGAEHASEDVAVLLHNFDSDTSLDDIFPSSQPKHVDLAIRSCQPSTFTVVEKHFPAEKLYAASSSLNGATDLQGAIDEQAATTSSIDGLVLTLRPASVTAGSDASSMVYGMQSHAGRGALVADPAQHLDEGIETRTPTSDFTAPRKALCTTSNSAQIGVEMHSPNSEPPALSDLSFSQVSRMKGWPKGKKRGSNTKSTTGIEMPMAMEDHVTGSDEGPESTILTTESSTSPLQAGDGTEASTNDLPSNGASAFGDKTTNLERPRSRHVTFNPEVIVTTPIETTKPRSTDTQKARTSDLHQRSEAAGKRRSVRLSLNSLVSADLAHDPLSSPVTIETCTDRTGSRGRANTSRGKSSASSSSSPLYVTPSRSTSNYKTPKTSGLRRLADFKSHTTPRRRSTPISNRSGNISSRRFVETPVRLTSDTDEDELA
ncbi:hypothetical protein AC579_7742 [Pseudocercospora musae]|uniref:GATA-type domain-containing protein n=1 Tax=Pseudocercospora musae TaxID=113226 RepID=A0A139IJP4_9PEZI|nr:hypothetical protein AC579_7742 [Pseudocercospora musae]